MGKSNHDSIRDLARIIQNLEAENLRLRDDLVNTERVIAWIRNPRRGRANTSFTEGPDRQIAYAVEDTFLVVKQEEPCNSLG
ncbi:MAG: hypothetical protein ACYCS8_15005 [Acidithiobacillus sp.]